MDPCPFCKIAQDEIVLQSTHCIAKWDLFPVTEGHILIIPKRRTGRKPAMCRYLHYVD